MDKCKVVHYVGFGSHFSELPYGLMPRESKYFRLSVQANRKHHSHPNIQFYVLNSILAICRLLLVVENVVYCENSI